ncbi:DinB family protein [Streptomyces sp. S.PNR 29]|uniref:mycothiol transferase n=1 Tax=Streptomyces sp. S.PNR 29 TaxID=2973805 RepID=UPI0025B0A3D9|nr:DinB family protein [Streptomyces sp. S.PNR 29]MDN0199055.1 DinB family protein [Streptomyces sp. S.PNR 29]
MYAKDILIDGYGRIQEEVHATVEGLGPDHLNARPSHDANSIAWLVWHLTRVQDDHVADAFELDQVWLSQDWDKRFGLGLPRHDTGYGHSSTKVGKVRVDSADLLTGYYDAVHEQTLGALRQLTAKDLERVVDDNWDPPVTLGVRLVSVLSDDLQHIGQAAYVRGLVQSTHS